jgi:CheY-like chemotaxis protein
MSDSSTDIRGTRVPELEGRRVLVVEDRGLIAARIAQILRADGCVVVGPVGTLKAGLELTEREGRSLDAALVDIDLRGEKAYPLAELLRANQVPFLFLTGYGASVIPQAWRDAPRLEKPIYPAALRRALPRLVAGIPEPPPDQGRFVGEPLPAVRDAWETIRRQRDLIMEGQIRVHASVRKWEF